MPALPASRVEVDGQTDRRTTQPTPHCVDGWTSEGTRGVRRSRWCSGRGVWRGCGTGRGRFGHSRLWTCTHLLSFLPPYLILPYLLIHGNINWTINWIITLGLAGLARTPTGLPSPLRTFAPCPPAFPTTPTTLNHLHRLLRRLTSTLLNSRSSFEGWLGRSGRLWTYPTRRTGLDR